MLGSAQIYRYNKKSVDPHILRRDKVKLVFIEIIKVRGIEIKHILRDCWKI
jgi:hypothetical protein